VLSAPSRTASLARRLAAAADPRRFRPFAASLLATTAAYVAALVLALIAVIFALMAAHAGLRTVVPDWAAALVISGVFLVLALVALIVARHRARAISLQPMGVEPLPVGGGTVRDGAPAAIEALVPLLEAALVAARRRPAETMLIALAAGFVAGSLRGEPRR
jgi:hypothetical protein